MKIGNVACCKRVYRKSAKTENFLNISFHKNVNGFCENFRHRKIWLALYASVNVRRNFITCSKNFLH